jgi:hypothetical protein
MVENIEFLPPLRKQQYRSSKKVTWRGGLEGGGGSCPQVLALIHELFGEAIRTKLPKPTLFLCSLHWIPWLYKKNFAASSIRAFAVRFTDGGKEKYVSDAIG